MMATAAEVLLGARGQRELLALMERDYQDTGAEGRCRRGCVGLRGCCAGSAGCERMCCAVSTMAIVLLCEGLGGRGGLWRGLVSDYCRRRRRATECVCKRGKVRLLELCPVC
jgi:hypothetical protein